jgi:predicted transposase/invertase (TIGR01784 family)
MNSGDSYDKVVKVISISILYFDLGKGEDYVYRGKTSFYGIHKHDELELSEEQQNALGRESVEELYPEFYLIKVKQFDDVAKDRLDEWIYFLKNEEIKDDFSAMGLQKAKQVLNILKLSDQERTEYERYEENLHYEASMYQSSYVSGERKGRTEGRTEGELLGKIKTIEELKQEGILSEEDYQKRIIPLQKLLKELEPKLLQGT